MATMHRIRAKPASPTRAAAVAGYLATLDHPETAATRRVYAATLAALWATLGAERPVADLARAGCRRAARRLVHRPLGARAPATINRNLTPCARRSATGTTRAG